MNNSIYLDIPAPYLTHIDLVDAGLEVSLSFELLCISFFKIDLFQVLNSDQIKSATIESLRFMNNKIKIIDNNMFGWVSLGELLSSGQSGAIGDLLPFSRGGYFLYFLAFSTQQSLGQMLIDPNWPSDLWESKAKITVLLKGGLNFEKSSRVSYIFSRAFIFVLKKKTQI